MKKLLLILSVTLAIIGCKKKYEVPPITPNKAGSEISLENLITSYNGSKIKFTDTLSVFATVTMDESDGNLYKSVYIQDGDFALNMRLLSAGGLYVGDSIRIDLNGTVLSAYNGVLQLDSVHADKNITKIAVDRDIKPLTLALTDVNANLQSRLIKLENVQFIVPELKNTYADAENNESRDIIIEDCDGNTLFFRNSGYSNFAKETVAQGNGSITAIVSIFNGSVQLLVRSFNEIKMNGERCVGIQFQKNFDDGEIESEGWKQYNVLGSSVLWNTSSSGGAPTDYAVIRNYVNQTNMPCENWMVSPEINLNGILSPILSFGNDVNYSGAPLQLLISTDYDGTSSPNIQGTWTDFTTNVNWDSNTNGWGFQNTGDIDLNQFLNQTIRIAFKYTGSSSDGSTWEIDDIKIKG